MKIVVDISPHGLGHLAQVTPLLRALKKRQPSAKLIIRSQISRQILSEFLDGPYQIAPPPVDAGLVMSGPYHIDKKNSYAAYREIHKDFAAIISNEAAQLRALNVDLLISDVTYTGLAGAIKINIPAFALCSFHWGEVIAEYFADQPEAERIEAEISDTYNSANAFLLTAPRTTLRTLKNTRQIPPLGRSWGCNRAGQIRAELDLPQGMRIGFVTFGGIKNKGYPEAKLPVRGNWVWLVPEGWPHPANRNDMISLSRLTTGFSFLDILASSDLVLTKTGYGTFIECASHAVPCLFLSRPDWPEAIEVESWMVENGYGAPLDEKQMASGEWFEIGRSLIDIKVEPFHPTGHTDAANIILSGV